MGDSKPNLELGLRYEDKENISPLFKLGPRDAHTVNWILEVKPSTLVKLESKNIHIGMMRCKIKLWDKSPQCYKCQRYGHTAKLCRADKPVCRKCAEEHDSRECKSESVKCVNCGGSHQASSKSCMAIQRASNRTLRRTDFGTVSANVQPGAPINQNV